MIYKMTLKDSVDTMTFNLLETPIVDKDIEGAVDNVTLDGNQYTDYLYLKKQYIQKWAIMCPDEYDELRGFYTRQFEEGEVPSYRVYYGANVTRDYTLNGDYFQFNAEGIETGMTLSQLLGNAEQTTYSGKNLLPPTADWTQTVSGVTITCSNGQYTFSGTSTANGSTTARATIAPYTIQSGDYFHYGNTLVSENINIQVVFTDATYFASSMNVANRIFSLESYVGKTIASCRVNFASGSTFNGAAAPMILHNVSTVADYEPYVGGIPAPNPQFPMPISTVTGAQNIKVVGKNLLNDTTVQRTIPSSGSFSATIPMTIEAGTYSFGAFANEVLCSESNYYVFQFRNGSTPIVQSSTPPTPMTLTAEEASQVDNMFLYFNSSFTGTYGGKHLTAMVCSGSTLGAYEPYQSQSYEVNLGKNLLDINSLAKGGVTVSNGVATGACNQFYTSFGQNTDGVPFIKMGGQLAISFKAYTDGNVSTANTNGLVVRVVYTDGTSGLVIYCKNNETTAVQHTTITTVGKDVASIQLTYANDGGNIWHISEFQIEEGSQATSYAPYFTPIELAKVGTYQDRIYKDDGKWYIEKQVGKVVFTGASGEQWAGDPYGDYWRVNHTFSDIAPISQNTDFAGLSDYFHMSTNVLSAQAIKSGDFCQYRNTSTVYFAPPLSVQSLSDWRTWLSTHPTTVYYALATPTTTEITDETLLSQLNFLASLYEGENNISLVGTWAQGEMEVFIRDVMSVETDVVPEVPVRLTLTDDGVINACGCRRNVQLTMRETTE